MQGSAKLIRLVVVVLCGVLFLWQLLGYLMLSAAEREPLDLLGPGLALGLGLLVCLILWNITKPPRSRRREFENAATAVGTLITARATSASLNDNPQLELTIDVHTAEGTVFRAVTKEYFNAAVAAQLVPGVTLAVRYLPNRKIAYAPNIEEEELTDMRYHTRVRRAKFGG